VRNLSEGKPRTPLLGVSTTDIPLQGASSSSTSTAREALGHLVSEVGGLCLAKKALSASARRKLKKARARVSEAGTEGHSATRECRCAQAGRNLDRNP
jgi:hypothetical protein